LSENRDEDGDEEWVLPKKEEPEPLAGIELPDVPRRKRSKRDHDVKVEKS